MRELNTDSLQGMLLLYWESRATGQNFLGRAPRSRAITATGLYAFAYGCSHGPDTFKNMALAGRILRGLVKHCDIAGNADAEGLLKEGVAFVVSGFPKTCCHTGTTTTAKR